MSKNSRQSNLLSFFNRIPRQASTSSIASPSSRKREGLADENLQESETDLNVSENKNGLQQVKRPRIVISSDDEEEENIPEKASEFGFSPNKSASVKTTPKKKGQTKNRVVLFEESDDDDEDENEQPKQETKIKTPSRSAQKSSLTQKRTPSVKKIGAFADSFIGSFRFQEEANEDIADELKSVNSIASNTSKSTASTTTTKKDSNADDDDGGEHAADERFPHLDYEFLKPEKIRDAQRRLRTDPDYDAKTLYVPDDFLRQQTPGHMQWWKFKSAHFDTILFFKVGKFYELYHMDAVIAVEALNLTYMRGRYAHCGFPEIGYGRFADQLINRGYKVARIEQTETPQQLEERCRRTNVKEKVVRREICRLTTNATRTYGVLDGTDNRETDGVGEPDANYLMAITEKQNQKGDRFHYGVCFLDCSTGQFYLSQFNDDSNRTSLRTLFAHNYPSQLLYEKDALSAETLALLNTQLCDVTQQALFPEREFWTCEKTLQELKSSIYFGKYWPAVFTQALLKNIDANEAYFAFESAISALGAITWYLKECKIDADLLSMRKFQLYTPVNLTTNPTNAKKGEEFWSNRCMILDGISLLNLHILPAHAFMRRAISSSSAFDSTLNKFSLFNTVNHCATAFGRRALQRWISTPSCDANILRERQDAVRVIVAQWRAYGAPFVDILRKIPDLERLFQRIHTLGLKHRAEAHPDARAQMFDAIRYNQRKIKDLVLALEGLETIVGLQKVFDAKGPTERVALLERCVRKRNEDMICDLQHFKSAFNRERALEEGVIVPHSNVDADYDNAVSEIRNCERKLDAYLDEQKAALRCSAIKYIGSGKTGYQMEIPESACARIKSDYTLLSQRKGFKRYNTTRLEELRTELFDAKRQLDVVSGEVTRKVFDDFDKRKEKWAQVVENIATFDCILSLACYATATGIKMCFPEFVYDVDEPLLEIRTGYHPALISAKSAGGTGGGDASAIDYIPNDCVLGNGNNENLSDGVDALKPVMLLTGPNMGGKSTLMRQVSSLVVLAQMGSMVPAASMRLTPVDRIFCRIGANDHLTAGQSTFFVELSETNVILREGTCNSLVLIDELGRGTSTHDGTAIAFAVLKQIANSIRCRTIFSTHYHALCDMIKADNILNSGVKLAHMACMSENENTDDPTEENITFLYTLTAGPASKSYGFYTAKVAGIDIESRKYA